MKVIIHPSSGKTILGQYSASRGGTSSETFGDIGAHGTEAGVLPSLNYPKNGQEVFTMNDLQAAQADRLRSLHGEIITAMRATLDLAIEAGAILHEVKAALPHGEFTSWVETNAGFSIRTAQRYMKIHENREELKNDSVSLLTDAHKMLTAPKDEIRINGLSLDDIVWAADFDEMRKRVAALGAEWETLKDSQDVKAVADFYRRAHAATVEATRFTFEAELKMGRALNEFKELVSTKQDAENFLNVCKAMDKCIEDGLTARDILQAGGEDYHVEFYEEWKASGFTHKSAIEALRLVQ